MGRDSQEIRTVSTRRELMKAFGGVGIAATMAGCSGGNGDTTTAGGAQTTSLSDGDTTTAGGAQTTSLSNGDTTTAGGAQTTSLSNGDTTITGEVDGPESFVDQRATYYTAIITDNPQEGQWNPFNPSGNFRPYYGHAKFGSYSPFTQEFLLVLFEDFEKQDDTLSLHLRDHHTWFPSGDDVTAQDLRAKFVLDDFITGSPLREGSIESYEIAGDKQLDLVLTNADIRPDLLFGAMIGDWLDIKYSVYQDWIESLADTTTDSERKSIREKIVNFRWENENVELSGQFEPPELQENAIIFTTRQDDGKPFAGMRSGFPNETLFTEMEVHVVPQGQTPFQLVLQDDSLITGFRGTSSTLAPAENNSAILTQDVPTITSYVMVPNPTATHLGDRAVRQAIAYALDLQRAAKVAMPNNLAPIPLQAGLMGAAGTGPLAASDFEGTYDFSYGDFITEYPIDSFRKYGLQPKPDEAAAVLQDAGYSRNSDDMWVDENDQVVGPNILSSDVADYFLNQTLEWATSLQNFGFDSTTDVLPYDQFFNRLGAGDYDTTIVAWFGSPPFGYNMESATYLQSARRDTPPQGWLADDSVSIKVPEYGNIDGDLMEVNVTKKLAGARSASDDATYNKLVSQLAWTANEALPTIFGGEIIDTIVARQDQWIWPEPGSAEFPLTWRQDALGRGVPLPKGN